MNTPETQPPASSATIMQQGYIIELAAGGPWLKNDLTWTPDWDERGVWHELADAELAMARSLSPTDGTEPTESSVPAGSSSLQQRVRRLAESWERKVEAAWQEASDADKDGNNADYSKALAKARTWRAAVIELWAEIGESPNDSSSATKPSRKETHEHE